MAHVVRYFAMIMAVRAFTQLWIRTPDEYMAMVDFHRAAWPLICLGDAPPLGPYIPN